MTTPGHGGEPEPSRDLYEWLAQETARARMKIDKWNEVLKREEETKIKSESLKEVEEDLIKREQIFLEMEREQTKRAQAIKEKETVLAEKDRTVSLREMEVEERERDIGKRTTELFERERKAVVNIERREGDVQTGERKLRKDETILKEKENFVEQLLEEILQGRLQTEGHPSNPSRKRPSTSLASSGGAGGVLDSGKRTRRIAPQGEGLEDSNDWSDRENGSEAREGPSDPAKK